MALPSFFGRTQCKFILAHLHDVGIRCLPPITPILLCKHDCYREHSLWYTFSACCLDAYVLGVVLVATRPAEAISVAIAAPSGSAAGMVPREEGIVECIRRQYSENVFSSSSSLVHRRVQARTRVPGVHRCARVWLHRHA